ncbi:MAG: hypothetical protein ABH830_01850 [Patescibacteria group bacterium]
MKKFNELPFYKQITRVYILSIVVSILLSPFFDKLYTLIFKPKIFGEGLFFPIPSLISLMITGFFFGIFLFLPLFVFWLLKKKQWKVWGVGIIIPALMIFDASTKHIFWALILSALGWGLAKGILLIKEKK